ncbi:helix-turn-helix domain-containing protein, partial [Planomonospora algeriensis]
MRRSLKFLLRPTAKQAAALAACLEDHRQLYNAALEHRRTAYAKAGVSVRYGDQSADLKHIRADDPGGQGRWSFSSQQATLRRLDKAFAAFFKRVSEGRIHKSALALVRDHDVIVHEDLRIANMARSASGTLDAPGRGVAAKSGLNRSILDAGWGVFLTILSY